MNGPKHTPNGVPLVGPMRKARLLTSAGPLHPAASDSPADVPANVGGAPIDDAIESIRQRDERDAIAAEIRNRLDEAFIDLIVGPFGRSPHQARRG
jgi:hypothetical protein